jgi:hypothetical protein
MSDVTVSMADLLGPLNAVRLLAGDFPHLPAPCVDFSTVYPDRVRLAWHDSLYESAVPGAFVSFERWRAALGIAVDAVTYGTQSAGCTGVLKACGTYGGIRLDLVAYSEVPARDTAGPDRSDVALVGGAA